MKKISIIVPVYNVEKYLQRCLESLVSQTISDFEVLVINDGSPDRSQDIIDEYTRKYSFVKSYIKENGGLSDARNYGISCAEGEYIAFVDGDDYVENSMFEIMYHKAKTQNFDIVVCDFEEIYPTRIVRGTSRLSDDLLGQAQIQDHMCDIYPSAWNKIYKRELFENNIRFKEKVWFEDVEWMYRLLPFVKSIGVVDKPFYKYIQREGSISKSNDLRIYHYIENWNGIIDFYKTNNIYHQYKNEIAYCYVRYLYATFIKSALKMDFVNYRKAVSEAQKNVKSHFPNYRKNKYFFKSLKGIYLLFFNKILAYVYYLINKLLK